MPPECTSWCAKCATSPGYKQGCAQGTIGVLLEAELHSVIQGLAQLPHKVLIKLSPADLPGMPSDSSEG